MLKVVNKNDLEVVKHTSKSPKILINFIQDYYNEMLSRFKCESLEGIGSIFLLDSLEDVVGSKLDDFLIKFPPQRVCEFVLYDNGNVHFNITQLLLNVNGFAVNIFAQEEYLKDIVYKHCISNSKSEVI